jgi:hypothetical protein
VARSSPGHGQHQAGVVDLRVVVADGALEVLGAQVGRDPGHLLAEQVRVLGHAHVVLAGHGHAVVQEQSGSDVRAFPRVVQRVEERHRPDQVRGQAGEQQAALLEGLADQAEVEHLQVAQAAVDQLAAA